MKEEYPVFCKWYGVLDQTFSVVERFPRWVRPTMGDHILGLSIEVIGHIVEAIYRPEQRLGKLEQINLELEKLRVLWRLCLERKWLSFAQYEQLESGIEESGKKLFISDSYATRKGKGTHRAIRKAQQLLQRNEWYLKMDISGYFASIDHAILLQTLGKKLKDPKMLQLVKTIVDHPQFETVGLPIGNLTSQFFANVYLDPFDHWVKDGLGTKGYMRYMDDFVFFSQEKEELKKLRKKVEAKLDTCFHLQTKASATQLNTRLHGLGFLGMRVFPAILRLRGKNLRRSLGHLRLRERQWKDGSLPEPNFLQSAQSIMGHLGGANTLRLRRALFG